MAFSKASVLQLSLMSITILHHFENFSWCLGVGCIFTTFLWYKNIFLVLVFMEPFYAIMREVSEAILIQTEKFFFSKTDSCFRKFWEMYLSEFMTISFSKHAYSVSTLNPFMAEVPIIKKPVHWFAGEFKRGRRS